MREPSRMINAACAVPSNNQLQLAQNALNIMEANRNKVVALDNWLKNNEIKGLPRRVTKWKEKYPLTLIVPYDFEAWKSANDWEFICKQFVATALPALANQIIQQQNEVDYQQQSYDTAYGVYEACLDQPVPPPPPTTTVPTTAEPEVQPTAVVTTPTPNGMPKWLIPVAVGGLLLYFVTKKKKRK